MNRDSIYPRPPKKVFFAALAIMLVSLPFWSWRGFFIDGQFDIVTFLFAIGALLIQGFICYGIPFRWIESIASGPLWLWTEAALIDMAFYACLINWGFLGRLGYDVSWQFFIFEWVLMYILARLLYMVFYKLYITSDVLLGIMLAFNITNYYVDLFRGEPLAPWDYQAMGTAGEVAGSYSFNCTSGMVIGYAILFTSHYIMSLVSVEKEHRSKKRYLSHTIVLAVAILVYVMAVYPNMEAKRVLPIRNYTSYGSLSGYVAYSKSNNQQVADYSDEKAEEILKNVELVKADDTKTQPVNIIMVMNESFGDLRVVGDSDSGIRDEVSNSLAHLDSLKDNTVRGNLYVDVYGGGTCNSEFEALTGVSNRYYPGYPYEYALKNQVSSVASILGDQGYATSASHPSKASNYHRSSVYPKLGFQETAFFPDLGKELKECFRAWSGNNIISDSNDYKWIESMEADLQQSGQKNFMFNVSIQNHSPYSYTDGKDAYKVSVDLSAYGDYPETEIYLTLLKESDKALQELVEYYSQVEEPTLICFFGDHQAMIESGVYDELYGKKTYELSEGEVQQKYITPFVMWANYDIQEEYVDKMSTNYLGMKLLEVANIDMDSYNSYLHELYKKWPVISTYGIYDSKGNYYEPNSSVDSKGDLLEYRYLQEYKIRGN